jgi:hypothetical protein
MPDLAHAVDLDVPLNHAAAPDPPVIVVANPRRAPAGISPLRSISPKPPIVSAIERIAAFCQPGSP